MVDHEEPGRDWANSDGDGVSIPLSDAPLSDDPLLDLLDTLVHDRGKVAAAEALGVNYRTMVTCHESRHVSRRMRKALAEFRDRHGDGGDVQEDEAGDIAGKIAALEEQVAGLKEAHGDLVETVHRQAKRLAELERRDEEPGEGDGQGIESGASEGEEGQRRERSEPDSVGDDDGQRKEWRPSRREHGLPDVGVVTVEEQPDEGHAFGPAAPLVAEWRGLRTGAEASGGRVDRARAAVRRWELEVAMLGDYGLTLPPETEPLDASRRENHLRWRRKALAEAKRALVGTERMRWLRRALTLGVWRK